MKYTAPLLRSAGELHVVGDDDILTIADPYGAVQRLVRLADGSRSTTELHSALAPEYPRLAVQDVLDAVAELEAFGVLEDATPRWYGRGEREPGELAAPSYY
jgi:hypothetical protein